MDAQAVRLKDRIPHWSVERAQRTNLLCSRGVYGQTVVEGRIAYWRLEVARKTITSPVRLRHLEHAVCVSFDNDSWSEQVEGRHWQDFSRDQWPLSFLLAREQWLQHFQQLSGMPWQVDATSFDAEPVACPSDPATWLWRVECQGATSQGLLQFDESMFASFIAQPCWHRTDVDIEQSLLRLPIELDVSLAAEPIAPNDLAAFEVGDVLIGGRASSMRQCFIRHRLTGKRLWQGHLDQSQIEIRQEWQLARSQQRESMSAPESKPGERAIDAIPVELEFQLGSLTLPLGDFNNIQPGHVFTLDRPAESNDVVIFANGKSIGKGTLVVVGEHLGVQFSEVGSSGT
ncbi:FliM/FliN family flagellar motor switch protein [Allohahella sp. A8]|uniref:FliM/FliN family flagellar motor switch protein n=1 Tax=Allohahella sp. A8 TaxID=3141461 RepID=UPI003A7F9ED1